MNFTDEQLASWRRYEKVRSGGRYNVFDPRARALTGLSEDEYLFCMSNYSELRDTAERAK